MYPGSVELQVFVVRSRLSGDALRNLDEKLASCERQTLVPSGLFLIWQGRQGEDKVLILDLS
ncbi:hypothetical protein CHH27_00840 [Labrenzia sp. VG12]|nr:hypothetical protein CHH27_00840 [Labrenzia sp. VG12]